MYQIGYILKAIREDKEYQLNDVQARTGIDSSLLSRIETGKRLPTDEQIQQLSNLYEIDKSILKIQKESDRIITSFDDSRLCRKSLAEALEKIDKGNQYLTKFYEEYLSRPFEISNRRYIGSKAKLVDWIFEIIKDNTEDTHSFCDLFAGTGIIASRATELYNKVIINDILFSNNVIYKAFLGDGAYDKSKIDNILLYYNSIEPNDVEPNYFSDNYGNKFFEYEIAKKIGYIREDIEKRKKELTEKEYCVLLTTLIYNIDKIANTLGHFEAYIQKPISPKSLFLKSIDVQCLSSVEIFREDSNILAPSLCADIVYIDPPYNSRQYSRFYHLYETLVKWDKPKLFGVAMKPAPENMSVYCSNKATDAMRKLVNSLKTKYIVVSYNNTYNSKSNSSENKITLEDLHDILKESGETKVFEHKHKAYNAGKTDFKDHKEFIFITKVNE